MDVKVSIVDVGEGHLRVDRSDGTSVGLESSLPVPNVRKGHTYNSTRRPIIVPNMAIVRILSHRRFSRFHDSCILLALLLGFHHYYATIAADDEHSENIPNSVSAVRLLSVV